MILLIAGIGLGIYLIKNHTNLLPKASISAPVGPQVGYTLKASSSIVPGGGEFYLGVWASSDFDQANLFVAVINYPADKVQILDLQPVMASATPSAKFFIKKWIEQTDDKKGKIILSGAVPNPGFRTDVGKPAVMAELHFKVIAKTGEIPLVINEESAIYRNSDNQNIIKTKQGTTIKIGIPPSPDTKVDTDGDGFYDFEEVAIGTDPKRSCGIDAWPVDVDNSKAINGGDVSFLVPYIDGTKPYNKRYDLNRDGKITRGDANQTGEVTVIQQYFGKVCNSAPSPSGDLCRAIVCPMGMPSGCHYEGVLTNTCDPAKFDKLTCGTLVCPGSPFPSATPIPPTVDGKRADLYKDPKKPNFVNDQDVSVFFTKCAEKGLELFGKPASVQPICNIFDDPGDDDKITVQDWAVLIKFRNKSV